MTMKTKVVIDDLRLVMEEYLEEIEDTVTPSPQIEVELENILDICAASIVNNDDYGKILGSVNRVKEMVYGD